MRYPLIPLVILALVSFSGCASHSAISTAGTQASGALGQDLDTSLTEMGGHPPLRYGGDRRIWRPASSAISSAKGKLPAVNKALSLNDSLSKNLAREQASFWSDRQRHLAYWIVRSVGLVSDVAVFRYWPWSGDLAHRGDGFPCLHGRSGRPVRQH